MEKKQLENIVREFNRTGENFVETKIMDANYLYTVKIEKVPLKTHPIFESIRGRVDTISALPAGSTCRACGGSGIQS